MPDTREDCSSEHVKAQQRKDTGVCGLAGQGFSSLQADTLKLTALCCSSDMASSMFVLFGFVFKFMTYKVKRLESTDRPFYFAIIVCDR